MLRKTGYTQKLLAFCLAVMMGVLPVRAQNNETTSAEYLNIEAETKALITDLNREGLSLESEKGFINRVNRWHGYSRSIDEQMLSDLMVLADEAFNQKMWHVFSAVHGIINDYHLSINDNNQVIAKVDRIEDLEIYAQINDSLRMELEIDRMVAWNSLFKNNNTIERFSMLEQSAKTLKQEARFSLLLAEAHVNNGNLSSGIDFYLETISLAEGKRDEEYVSIHALALNSVGVVYMQTKDYDTALNFLYDGLELAYANELDPLKARIHSNLGVVYKNVESFNEAVYHYNEGRLLAEYLGDQYTVAQNTYNLGNIYFEEEKLDSALIYFEQVDQMISKWDMPKEQSLVLMMLGSIEKSRKNYSRSDQLLNEALTLQKNINDPFSLLELYNLFQELKQGEENYTEALYYHELAETLSDSLDEEAQRAELQKKVSDHELQKAQLEKELVEQQLQVQKSRSRGLVVIMMTIVGFVLIISGYQKKQAVTEKKLAQYSVQLTQMMSDQPKKDSYKIYFSPPDKKDINENKALWELFNKMVAKITIEKLYEQPILTIAELAREVKSNTQYVSKAINTFSGFSFNHFINRFRIVEARNLLVRYPINIPLEQIMEKSGFQNRATFYRAFKNEVGITPKKFRDQVKDTTELN